MLRMPPGYDSGMAVLLVDFAKTLDATAATSSKLAKQKILGDFFRSLEAPDLQLAVRYTGGRAFAATDERVLGVSSRTVRDVALELLNVDADTFRTVAIRRGETGEAVGELWPPPADGATPKLTLQDLTDAFDRLGATTQPAIKRPIVRDLFARCVLPREACYLAKLLTGDMRTGVKEGVLQAAVAVAFDAPLADVLRAQLLVGDLEEVATLAARHALAEARFTLFHPLQFMLAQPIETASEVSGEWVIEDKLDGIRAQVHKQADRIAIYTRTMDRTDESFPDVVRQISKFKGDCILDGEIVPWRDGRALAFAVLQKRLGRKTVSDKQLRDHPAAFIAFDLLYLNDTLLLDLPLVDRQKRLRAWAESNDSLIVLPSTIAIDTAQVETAFAAARDAGNEGLMLKQPQSTYTPGRRGGAWLKLKSHLPTLDCVVTAAEYGHGKRRGTLSDYTFAVRDGDRLVNIGKAYSGVTDEEIAQLTELFKSIALSDNGRVFQVRPQVVMEIAFDQILESSRHASGFAMRFPRIKRIRTDKLPEDADTLERVREIYSSVGNLGKKMHVIDVPEPTLFDGLLE